MPTKRMLIALIVGLIAFGAAFASAAALNVSTKTLGAGNAVVASCDTDGITVSYTLGYTSTAPAGYKVNSVQVAGIAATCQNLPMQVTLVDANGTSIGSVTTATVPTGGGSSSVDVTAQNVSAAAVRGVHVVISG